MGSAPIELTVYANRVKDPRINFDGREDSAPLIQRQAFPDFRKEPKAINIHGLNSSRFRGSVQDQL